MPPGNDEEAPTGAPADASETRTGLAAAALLVAVSICVSLIVGELGLRVLWQNPYREEAPDQLVRLWTQHPSTDRLVDRSALGLTPGEVRLRTDARAYIRPSFQHERPDATIAFLGGSTTACSAVQEPLRFHHQVSVRLLERGLRVNTLNAGRAGATLHDSVNLLVNHVVLDRPDVAVVMHAINDYGLLHRDPTYSSRMGRPASYPDLLKWTTQLLSKRLDLIGLAREAANVQPELNDAAELKNHPNWPKRGADAFRARLRIFIHASRDLGIVPVLMTQPISSSRSRYTPDWTHIGRQDLFNQITREVSADEGVLLIDLVRQLQAQVPDWNEPGVVFYDGVHVNDQGSSTYADFIARALEGPLRSLAQPGPAS
jgi:lysophospholipase L1-like esterase